MGFGLTDELMTESSFSSGPLDAQIFSVCSIDPNYS